MPSPEINTFREITPLIYSWTTPDIPKYAGWEKIGYTEQASADALALQSLKYMVDPAHIGALAYFLSTEAARSISGQTIGIDGASRSIA